MIMSSLSVLSESELSLIVGGSWFSNICGDISKALGRDGKPFIGRDVVEAGVGAVVKIAVTPITGPFVGYSTGTAASKAVSNIYDKKK
jgi:hypothetical protein